MARIWDLSNIGYLTEQQHLDFEVGLECDDVIAVGGKLSPGILLSAYGQGIFPWYNEGEEIMWWSPKERFVLFPEALHISKSLRRCLRKDFFKLSLDRAFEQVISACGVREGVGTWITPEIQAAYNDLHMRGYAHSVEYWSENELLGGLYGVSLGRCFFGESMFCRIADASKLAFVALVLFLREKGFRLIDCQQESKHLGHFGAQLIARQEFHSYLEPAGPSFVGSWSKLWPEFPHSKSLEQLLSGRQDS